MKLYYVNYGDHWGPGIEKKINNHILFFKKNGFDTYHLVVKNKKGLYRLIIPFMSKYDYSCFRMIERNSIVFIRYNDIDFWSVMNFKKINKKGVPIYIEIPTFPYDYEFKHKWILYKDKIMRKFLQKYVKKIFTYSNHSKIFNIPCINISNFVDSELISKKKDYSINNEINLIAVASLKFWHGYDRVIEGLNNYYSDSSNINKKIVKFHMVGDGETLQLYLNLVQKYHLEKYVFFYGIKKGKDLDKIYDQCDIGVDSLGRHRCGVYYNSSLKGKEYMMKGLPIISGVETELDNMKDYPYYLKIPSTDEAVDINNVIQFYNKIYKNKDKNKIISYISNKANDLFNIDITMKPILDELQNNKYQ